MIDHNGAFILSHISERGTLELISFFMDAFREGEGLRILDQRELQAMKMWDNMSISQKVADWSMRHQYTLIMGGWAGSLGLAGAIISRQKYQTFPQKIVQARMWAQGLTIGLLIVAGALTHASRQEFAKHVSTPFFLSSRGVDLGNTIFFF